MRAPVHGRPSAAELVDAVAEFLESDVRDATGTNVAARGDVGRVNFHARVAANALRMVQRELGQASLDGPAAGLAGLDVSDEAQLAAAIRDGRLDDRAEDVLPALRRLVGDRLDVAHPGYAAASVADRLFSAIEAGDVESVAAMWSDEVTVWHAGDKRRSAKARAIRVIEWLLSVTADRHYDVLDRQHFHGGFVQQHILHGTTRTGTAYSLRVGIIVRVSHDGLITQVDEYFDPADLAPLRTAEVSSSER